MSGPKLKRCLIFVESSMSLSYYRASLASAACLSKKTTQLAFHACSNAVSHSLQESIFPTLHHTHKTQSLDLAIPISLSMDATISNGLVATLMDCRSTRQGVYNGTYHSCIGLTLKFFNELLSVWEGWIEERAMSYTHLATDIPCGSGNNNSTCILALVTTLLRLITTIKFISS